MDPEVKPASAMERITSAAEAAGAKRREKIMKTIDRFLGAPEAAGEAWKIAGENIDAFKQRTEDRLVETAMNLAERADNSWARFTNRVTETRDRAVNKAREWKDRAVRYGLTQATRVEDKVVEICEIPAGKMERAAAKETAEAQAGAEAYARQVVEQMTSKANLSVEQRRVLEELLAAQEVERQQLEVSHEEEREELGTRIEGARKRASELKAGATSHREGVEKRRIFKGLLASVTGGATAAAAKY